MKPRGYTYSHIENVKLNMDFYETTHTKKNITILYFHGGGLLFGQRSDLSEDFIELFLENGYNFLAIDYPLAPETSVDKMIDKAKEAIDWFIDTFESDQFILFGRSAGGYICTQLILDPDMPKPLKYIHFYGYDSIRYPEFQTVSSHYASFKTIPKPLIDSIISSTPVTNGSIQSRFALYIYARQTGKWPEMVGWKEGLEKSLNSKNASLFPPTFIAHSRADKDVPYSISENMHQLLPNSTLFDIKDMEHDFDRDSNSIVVQDIYKELIAWLD